MPLASAAHPPLAVIDLNGTGGNVLLLVYIVGGLAMIVASLLPGNSTAWKILGPILGVLVVGWSTYVLVFGGWIPISFYLLILPVLLVIRGIRAMATRGDNPAASPYGPPAGYAGQYGRPATPDQYGQPGQYGQQYGTYAGAPQQGGYGQPQDGQGWGRPGPPQQPYVPPGTENRGRPQQPPAQQGGWGAPPNSWN